MPAAGAEGNPSAFSSLGKNSQLAFLLHFIHTIDNPQQQMVMRHSCCLDVAID